jgi:asparagine synthase (glutamine-hydrolysing)
LRVDRNISHFGLEARVPFLDETFVNLYYKIAPELIIPTKERMEKYLIRKAF